MKNHYKYNGLDVAAKVGQLDSRPRRNVRKKPAKLCERRNK